jgi:hypothetical protein
MDILNCHIVSRLTSSMNESVRPYPSFPRKRKSGWPRFRLGLHSIVSLRVFNNHVNAVRNFNGYSYQTR